MQALHFGAGSIGRGFIGDLLKESGYDLTFVDTNIQLNEQMQQQGGYDIYTIEKGYQLKFIPIKLALSPVTQRDEVIRQCITADIITTAVWADNLGKIAPLLLAGLQARQRAGKPKINVIVCENALFNGHILRQELLNLGEKEVDSLASFPNTAVDRMVLSAERNGKNVI
ncbi:TPA: mannitol dehydrogenase, partial [Klebsiella pneumoniae]|nr:mannitol dehydrogenase [Klebsiella pneumoniae]